MPKDWAKSFYNSGVWKTVRRQALSRDHYTCTHCYRRAEHVHHIIELSPDNLHDYTISLNPDNLQSLCMLCHDKETKGCADLPQGFIFNEDGQVVRG